MSTLSLPDSTADGQARAEALDRRHRPDVEPASMVSYVSHGRVLVIGDEARALEAVDRLDEELIPTLFLPADKPPATSTVDGLTVVRGGQPQLEGSLGNFRIGLVDPGNDNEAAAVTLLTQARFDLVLDLGNPPLMRQEVPPPGYYAPGTDAEALEKAIDELPEMRGEFEKPKFFNYDPDICAHGRRGIKGCTRCLEVCPAWAITSIGELVSINPNLCQGFGSCAAVCPTGAITYAFPSTGDLLGYLHTVLERYREVGGSDPVLVFFDNASSDLLVDDVAAALPENALPVELEEIGSLGMDAWLACLAYGARRVLVLAGPETPPGIAEMLGREIGVTAAILEGMGYAGDVVQVLDAADAGAVAAAAQSGPALSLEQSARFAPPPEKRLLLRTAINFLLEHAPGGKKVAQLPAGSPFGQVKVDRAACTLCMSCVAVCPTSALREGQGLPQLNFVERSCVQCGMCEKACPEDAVSLEPRFLYNDKERGKQRLLYEEQPACCISCGKPFATRSMLKVMAKKLEDHWMFQGDAERRRLEMCEDCRVRDRMRSELGGGPPQS
ncbi:MAG: 4Fe-4S binding protein [Woeseiaceae bacterium]